MPAERSGVHLTGVDSGWPVAAAVEPDPHKDGTGDDDAGLAHAASVSGNEILTEDATNEVQTVTVDATGGTFTLTFAGQTTGAIVEDAAAAVVQAALEALSNLAPGDVVVTGSAGGPYTVTFGGAYDNQNVEAMTASGASLTGGAGTAVVTTPTQGSD